MHNEAPGQAKPAGRKRVLICFHPKDRDGKAALVAYLGKVQPPLVLWSVDEVAAGKAVRAEFLRVAASADAALVLLSPDFCQALTAPESLAPHELTLAEQRRLLWRQESRRRLIPVVLRPCPWAELPFGAALAPLPPGSAGGAALQELDAAGRDRALAELAQQLGALDPAPAPSAEEQVAARALAAAAAAAAAVAEAAAAAVATAEAEEAAAAAAALHGEWTVGKQLAALALLVMLGFLLQAVLTSGPRPAAPPAEPVRSPYAQPFLVRDVPPPPESAQTEILRGMSLHDDAERATGDERARLLAAAVQARRRALRLVTRQAEPQVWAEQQYYLGRALYDQQSPESRDAETAQLLDQSVNAYGEALGVYTHNGQPQQWAETQHHLGLALFEQSQNVAGAERALLLGKAVQAYRDALTVYTLQGQPESWAEVEENLGLTLGEQRQNASGDEPAWLLSEEAQAYREALRVYTRAERPLDWARLHDELCIGLAAAPAESSAYTTQRWAIEAVQSCQKALQVYTQKDQPESWADTQNHLGYALLEASQSAPEATRPRLREEAIQAYRKALQGYKFAAEPESWAEAQTALGSALDSVGRLTPAAPGLRLLAEAAQCYRQALQVYTPKDFPAQWADTQNDLGVTLSEQSQRAPLAQRPRLLGEELQSYRSVLQEPTPELPPQSWLRPQSNLILTLTEQAKATSGPARQRLLAEAVELGRLGVQKFSDEQEAARTLFILYQEQCFEFARAYAVLAAWLQRHPEDLDNQANFAESELTTGRFTKSAERLAGLVANPAETKFHLALQTLEVIALTALGKPQRVATQLRALRQAVAAQPPELKHGWSFAGVKVFLARDDRLVVSRAWLLKLIAALEKPERAACLPALDAVIAEQPQ